MTKRRPPMTAGSNRPIGTAVRHKDCGGKLHLYRGHFKCSSCQAERILPDDREIVTVEPRQNKRVKVSERPDMQHYSGVGKYDTWIRKRSK